MRRAPILLAAVLLLGGCVFYQKYRSVEVGSRSDGWGTTQGEDTHAEASYHGRLADLVVSVCADDPYTPVRLRVRPGDAASVTICRGDRRADVVGAWRLTDRKSSYVGTRVPRALGFGEAVEVSAGTDLLVEFDHGTVSPGSSLSTGDTIEFDLRIQVGEDVEAVPIRLEVLDTHRRWGFWPSPP